MYLLFAHQIIYQSLHLPPGSLLSHRELASPLVLAELAWKQLGPPFVPAKLAAAHCDATARGGGQQQPGNCSSDYNRESHAVALKQLKACFRLDGWYNGIGLPWPSAMPSPSCLMYHRPFLIPGSWLPMAFGFPMAKSALCITVVYRPLKI